jgi:amiloride-sensitive sodium channel subunit alpha
LLKTLELKAIYKMSGLNETEKKKLSRPIEEILVPPFCSFNIQKCTFDDFSWYFDSWYGNCWIFNSGYNRTGHKVPLVTNSQPGEAYGLQMSLYVNYYDNLSIFNSNPFYGGGLGAVLRIDNSSYLTSYTESDGFKLPSGFKTSVSLTRSFKSNLPRPFSNCLIDNQTNVGFHSDLFDLIQNSKFSYTQKTCYEQCYERAIQQECNCTDPIVKSLYSNVVQCFTRKEIDCMQNLYLNRILKNDFIQENCLAECPQECYSNSFDVSFSLFELQPKYYFEYLNSNLTHLSNDFVKTQIDEEKAQKSFVNFKIFYKQLSYEISAESPQLTLITLISNIASNLSLFLGVSVFSLFEPIQVLIEYLCMKYQ